MTVVNKYVTVMEKSIHFCLCESISLYHAGAFQDFMSAIGAFLGIGFEAVPYGVKK